MGIDARLLRAVTARRDQQNLRFRLHDILQMHAERRRADFAQNVFPARHVNHFRNPVAANIERLQPFQERHAGTIRRWRQLLLQRAEARADLLQQGFRLMTAAGFFPDPQNVAPDIDQILRIQAKHFGASLESRQRRS